MCKNHTLKKSDNGLICKRCNQKWANYTEFNAKREQNTHILAQMIAKRDAIGGFSK